MLVDLRSQPVSLDEAVAHVSHGGAGAVCVFLGVVRDVNEGRRVERLEYQAYDSMARAELERIAREVEAAASGVRVAALHRTGSLVVGEVAVVCAACAPHRAEAFEATRRLIEGIKARVPIWKREHGPDGAAWVGWVDARCATHDHAAIHRPPEG
jgi:molybdopterin synthase catalytic subunit